MTDRQPVPFHRSGVKYALMRHLDLDTLMKDPVTRKNVVLVLCDTVARIEKQFIEIVEDYMTSRGFPLKRGGSELQLPYHPGGILPVLRSHRNDMYFRLQEKTTRDNIERVLCGPRNYS